MSYPTARSDLRRLEQAGIVRRLSGAPQVTYYSVPIFNVVYGH